MQILLFGEGLSIPLAPGVDLWIGCFTPPPDKTDEMVGRVLVHCIWLPTSGIGVGV